MNEIKLKDLLRRARRKKGWGEVEASKKLGISRSYIWELENGRSSNPTLHTIAAFVVGYGLSASEIISTVTKVEQ